MGLLTSKRNISAPSLSKRSLSVRQTIPPQLMKRNNLTRSQAFDSSILLKSYEYLVTGQTLYCIFSLLKSFLIREEITEKILRVQSESTSTAQKMATETQAILTPYCIFSKRTRISFKSILIWRYSSIQFNYNPSLYNT